MAEKRMIDADTLLETIHDTADGLADCDQQNAAWALRKYAVRDIMGAPTVDAVKVVRCRDCRYWEKFQSSILGEVMCCIAQGEMNVQKDPYDFCSYGERRTDG